MLRTHIQGAAVPKATEIICYYTSGLSPVPPPIPSPLLGLTVLEQTLFWCQLRCLDSFPACPRAESRAVSFSQALGQGLVFVMDAREC